MAMKHDLPFKEQKSWVKVTRGLYRGDIGLVKEINKNDALLEVLVVPCIRFDDKGKGKRSRGRPPPALFDVEKVQEFYGHRQIGHRNSLLVFKKQLYTQGFLQLSIPITHTTTSSVSVTPQIEALYAPVFEQWGVTKTPTSNVEHHTGDNIQFVSGPWAGEHGKVVNVQGDTLTFTLLSGKSATIYQGLVEDACKLFSLGDLVEVTTGEHLGSVGYVTGFNGTEAEVFQRRVLISAGGDMTEAEGTMVCLSKILSV